MNQDRLDDLEKKVAEIEDGNGWHESAKYVLKKLDTLTDAVKENRTDNANAHKALHDKMDSQKDMIVQQTVENQRMFLPNRTFHWLLIVIIVLFGASFSLSGTALKQNADHKVKVTEYKTILDIEHQKMKKQINDLMEPEVEAQTHEVE